jgi:hypothetical protein
MINYDPAKFADASFAQAHSHAFDAYVDLRVRGVPRDLAVMEAFELISLGADLGNVDKLGMAAEVNPYVKARFNEVLESKVIKTDLWTKNRAVHNLLKLIEDPRVRDTTRLNAINSLNALCEYVTLDEGLKKRIGNSIADFEKIMPSASVH